VASAPNLLTVEVTLPREDVALLTVGGYLDIDTGTALRHHLAVQIGHGRRHFVLDLSEVPFMDSSGMNVLLWAYQQVRGVGGGVHVASPTPEVRRVLELTGVSLTVPVSGSVDDALALVARQEPRTESPA
jgi:stage II sporulation protein AA (anti-sigma F factor antagonist)